MSINRGCMMIRGRRRANTGEPATTTHTISTSTSSNLSRRRRQLDPAFPSPSKAEHGGVLTLSSPGIRTPVRRVRSGAMNRARSRSPSRSLLLQQPRAQSCRNLTLSDQQEPVERLAQTPSRNALKDLLGDETLKNITDIKSEIAGMRPMRRKIRFAERTPDDDDWKDDINYPIGIANSAGRARISSLTVDDLTIRGQVRTLHDQLTPESEDAKSDAANNLEDEIEIMEGKIRKAFKTLKRTKKEAGKESELIIHLETENKALRRELLAMPVPHGQSSMRQSLKQLSVTVEMLRKKVEEVDEQVTMLEWQRQQLEIQSEQLLMQMMNSPQHEPVSEELSVSLISSSETSLLDGGRSDVPLGSLLRRRQSVVSTEEASEIDSYVSTEINEAVKHAFAKPILVGSDGLLRGRRSDTDEGIEKRKSKSSSTVKISMATVELGPCSCSVPAAA